MSIAKRNLEAQEQLFRDIQEKRSVSIGEVATRLGVSQEEAKDALNGEDLTLTELRLLAVSTGVVIEYRVTGLLDDIQAQVDNVENFITRYNSWPEGLKGR